MIGYREPGYLRKLDEKIPFVWGATGGHGQVPRAFLPFFAIKDRLVYRLRNVLNAWQMKNLKRVQAAMKRTDVLFAAIRADLEAIHCFIGGRPQVVWFIRTGNRDS